MIQIRDKPYRKSWGHRTFSRVGVIFIVYAGCFTLYWLVAGIRLAMSQL